MKSTTWEGILSTGIKGLGMLGGPATSFAANIIADPLANAIIPDDKPQTRYRQIYPQLGPGANTTQTSLADPISQKYTEMPEETPGDRILGTAMPLLAGAMPLFMNNSGGLLGGMFGGQEADVAAKVPTAEGVVKARGGLYTHPNAPTHEQGGVNVINVEGGELVLNAKQLDEINSAGSDEERGRRFSQIQQMLMSRPVTGDIAEDGLYNKFSAMNPNQLFDLRGISKPEIPINESAPSVVPSFEGYMAPLDNVATISASRLRPRNGLHGPFVDPNQRFDISGMSRPELSLYNYSPEELAAGKSPNSLMNTTFPIWEMAPQEQALEEISPYDMLVAKSKNNADNDSSMDFIEMAKRASSDTRRKQNLLDASALGVVLGSLVGSPMPMFDHIPNTPLQAPEYQSFGRLMSSNLDKALATSRASIKDRGMNERLAMEGNILNTQMQGQSEIAKHEIDVSNANRGAAAETENKQIEQDMAVLLANRQADQAVNIEEHNRRRELVNEAHKLGQTMLTRSGRDDQNQANMEMLNWLISQRGTPEFEQLMYLMESMSAGGQTFNALT